MEGNAIKRVTLVREKSLFPNQQKIGYLKYDYYSKLRETVLQWSLCKIALQEFSIIFRRIKNDDGYSISRAALSENYNSQKTL